MRNVTEKYSVDNIRLEKQLIPGSAFGAAGIRHGDNKVYLNDTAPPIDITHLAVLSAFSLYLWAEIQEFDIQVCTKNGILRIDSVNCNNATLFTDIEERLDKVNSQKRFGFSEDDGSARPSDLVICSTQTKPLIDSGGIIVALEDCDEVSYVEVDIHPSLGSFSDACRFARVLEASLESWSAGANSVGECSRITKKESAIRLKWNATESDFPLEWLPNAIEKHAAKSPKSIAVHDSAETLTFAQFQMCVERWSSFLDQSGIRKNDRVAIALERSAKHLVLQTAVMRVGGSVVLVDPSNPSTRISEIIDDSNAYLAFAEQVTIDEVAERNECKFVDPYKFELQDADPIPMADLSDDMVCHVAYTSGSTGKPKAVLQRHRGQRNLAFDLVDRCRMNSSTRGAWLTSSGYGMVEVDPIPVLFAGGSVHIPPNDHLADPLRLAKWFDENEITDALVMTSTAQRVWAIAPTIESLRTMRIAGERLTEWPPATSYEVLNVYGTAEATVSTCANLSCIKDLLDQSGTRSVMPPVGKPTANVRAHIIDELGRPVPVGVRGELLVSGKNLSAGYGDQKKTSEKFVENFIQGDNFPSLYKTGDHARYWPDGTIEVLGRTDEEVKIRGHRVHLGSIESRIYEHDNVDLAAVICQQQGSSQVLTAFVTLKDISQRSATLSSLTKELADVLPEHMQPRTIEVLEFMPISTNGKVDKAKLRKEEYSTVQLDQPNEGSSSASEVEKVVLEIWREILGLESIGLNDEFMALGGDSLQAMDFLVQVQKKLNVTVSLEDLQKNSTISSLSRIIERSTETAPTLLHVKHDPDNAHEPFDLTEVQQALWVGRGNAVDYGQVGAHGYFEYENPNFDLARFRKAWVRMVERHGMLRCVLDKKGTQRILSEAPGESLQVLDLRDYTPSEAHSTVLHVREEMSDQVIDPYTWPLYDIRVTLLPGGVARLHFGIDMLIMDAWSIFQVFFHELIELYDDPHKKLPELDFSFRDYVVGRKEKLASTSEYERSKLYWKQRLDSLPAAPDLPTVNPSEDEATRFDRCAFTYPAEDWEALQAIASNHRVTPSGLILAAFSEVVRAWSANTDFTINFPIFDRMDLHENVPRLLGDFTNTLLVSVEDKGDTFAERAALVQRQMWSDLEHRHFNGVEVLRELARNSEGRGSSPQMPIVITSLLGQPERRQVSSLGRETYGVSQTPQVLLDVQVREIDKALHVKWDYLGAHFPSGMISDMFSAFTTIIRRLRGVQSSWDEKRFDLLPEHQERIRSLVNQTDASNPEIALPQLFSKRVHASPDAVAVMDSTNSLTYSELYCTAAEVAFELIKLEKADRDSPVLILLPKSSKQYVAAWGAVLAGVPYAPISPNTPRARLQQIVEDSGSKVILSDQGTISSRDDLNNSDLTILPIDSFERASARPLQLPNPTIKSDDIAYIIYTSGSTGTPKGVAVRHLSVVNHLLDVSDRFGIDETSVVLGTAQIVHDLSVFDLLGAPVCGARVILPEANEEPQPSQWFSLAQEQSATFWAAVPAVADMVAEIGSGKLPALKTIILAGDWIPLELPDRLKEMAPNATVTSAGGPTETVNLSIYHTITHVDPGWSSIPYGRPMRNHKYHILDEELRPRPDWVPGMMWDESEVGLAHSYWRNQKVTEEKFRFLPSSGRRMFKTGDIGRYLPDGSIEILGRDDFQVKINGHRVELGDLEYQATQHSAVIRAVALLVPSSAKKRLALFVLGKEGKHLDVEEFQRFLRTRLPKPLNPHQVVLLKEWPLTRNGKLDREQLILSANDQISSAKRTEDESPLTELLVDVYSEILQIDVAHSHVNFYEAGGDSVAAMRVAVRLEELFGFELPVKAILTAQNPSELAEQLLGDLEVGEMVRKIAEALQSVDYHNLRKDKSPVKSA